MAFQKLSKTKTYVRFAIQGPSGGGKTWTSMAVADELAKLSGKKACIIDTEHGSAAKYAKDFPDIDGDLIVGEYQPKKLIAKIREAVADGYGACIVDSITHFWIGPKGFLEMIDEEVLRMRGNNQRADSHSAWKKVDKEYQRFIQDLLAMPIHLILCMRAKQKTERKENGKIEKIGLDAQMRADFEYEFDIEGMIDMDHNLVIGKNRTGTGLDGKIFHKPGADLAKILHDWCQDGDGEFRPVETTVAPVKQEPARSQPKAPESKPDAQQPAEEKAPPDFEARADYFRAALAEATTEAKVVELGQQINRQLIGHKQLHGELRDIAKTKLLALKAPKPEEAA